MAADYQSWKKGSSLRMLRKVIKVEASFSEEDLEDSKEKTYFQ